MQMYVGFEQTILEIVSIIRGESIAGLKTPLLPSHALSLKKCLNPNSLVNIMVSATLTQQVQQLALPLMGGRPFKMVDADREQVLTIARSEDIIAQAKEASQPRKSKDGVTSFEHISEESNSNNNNVSSEHPADDSSNDEEGDEPKTNNARNTGIRTLLGENEQIDTPVQLAQYYMNVTCKWRLAALISFLRTKVIVEKSKVIVFFSTCDAVDYHALLFRQTPWPREMDGPDALHLTPEEFASLSTGRLTTSSNSSSSSSGSGAKSDDNDSALYNQSNDTLDNPSSEAVGSGAKVGQKNSLDKQGEVERMVSEHLKKRKWDPQAAHMVLPEMGPKVTGGLLGHDIGQSMKYIVVYTFVSCYECVIILILIPFLRVI